MIERQESIWLKESWDTITTGRRPRCSEPDLGLRSAQQTSPRFIRPQMSQPFGRFRFKLRIQVDGGPGVPLGELSKLVRFFLAGSLTEPSVKNFTYQSRRWNPLVLRLFEDLAVHFGRKRKIHLHRRHDRPPCHRWMARMMVPFVGHEPLFSSEYRSRSRIGRRFRILRLSISTKTEKPMAK